MNKLLLTALIPLLMFTGFAQTRTCLRILPMDELTRASAVIARVKVVRARAGSYQGTYGQFAILQPVEVIQGNFSIKELYVLAQSNVPCADDRYLEKQEFLVFLEPEASLFHTVNYQYGQFLIEGEIVKGWRDKNGAASDRPFVEVRQEILRYLSGNPPE